MKNSSSSGLRTTGGAIAGAQRPTWTSTAADRARPASPAPAPALALALALALAPSFSPAGPSPPSFRRGKWLDAEYEEVWRLAHTYILASSSSSSSSAAALSPPSPSPSSSIATPSPPPPPPSSTTPVGGGGGGAGAGSVQDWENLRLDPVGLMKTEARFRSASALRSMFLKMRKESLLQQQQQQEATRQQDASTRSGVKGGANLALPSSFSSSSSSSSSSTFRVRFKSHVFEPSASRTTPAGVVTAAPSSAAEEKAEEREEGTKDSWTPAEDAVLLAAMITLPTPTAVVASSSSATSPPAQTPTSLAQAGRSGNEAEAQQQITAKGSESVKEKEERDEVEGEIEEASTPLARAAAAWPPTATTTTTTRDPRQQLQIASRSTTTTTTAGAMGPAAHNSLTTTSAGWLRVHEIAERTYRIMEAHTVQTGDAHGGGGGGGGGGATQRTRRLRRDVKELENRWRTKWRVDGITKNLAAPELLLPAIRQQSDVLSKVSVDVLTELNSSSSSRQRDGGAATAVAAVDSSPRPGSSAPTSSSAPFVVQQQQQEERPEPSAPLTIDSQRGDAGREKKPSQDDDDDPRAAYPTPAMGTDALPRNEAVEEDGRDDPAPAGIHEMDEWQPLTTTATFTPNLLEPAPPPRPDPSAPGDAQVQDRQLSTPAAPQAATAAADAHEMIGLGLDLGRGIETGTGGPLQQPQAPQPPPFLYNNSSAIPTANLAGTEELDPDRGDVRLMTTSTIPLRRASSSAVLPSPLPSPSPAAVLLPSQKSMLSTNRAATSFAPFTELYKPPSNVDALRRAHQSQPQPQPPPPPPPFQMYFQPKPRPLMPFSVEPHPQQQQQRVPQQQPVSPVHSLRTSSSASVSYRPFSRFLTTPTTMTPTTDPPPSSASHRDMVTMHGSLASSASSSSRGHSFLGIVQEEGLSPRPPQNVAQPLYQPPQVHPLLPTISSGDDPDRHHDRGTKRRWSEADLYARSPIYLYETSLGPPNPPPDTRSCWPWTFATELAGGPVDQQPQRQPNALDRAIAAGRPLADYSPAFDRAGDENDQNRDGNSAFTHQHAEREKEG